MRFRINGWYRIGIVASLVFALYGADHEMKKLNKAETANWMSAYDGCEAVRNADIAAFKPDIGPDDCIKRSVDETHVRLDSYYEEVAMSALLPVAMGWIAILIGVGIGHWVWRGFRPKPA